MSMDEYRLKVLSEPRSRHRDRLLPAGAAIVCFLLGAMSSLIVVWLFVVLLEADPIGYLADHLP